MRTRVALLIVFLFAGQVALVELEDQRQLSLYGRYSLNPDWALGVETLSRDATGLFQLRDFRIGVQRRF